LGDHHRDSYHTATRIDPWIRDGEAPMSTAASGGSADISFKIARLLEERGWNQEDFSRISQLNRHTVRQILNGGPKRRLRNATVSQCADALGLTVNELRTQPLDRLLPRMHGKPAGDEEALKILRERATLPDLVQWLERNPGRSAELHADEITEILEMQVPGGLLEALGVEQVVEKIERRRQLLGRVRVISGTDYLAMLEQLVDVIFEKVTRKTT
jgi:transcriptional regulator with XRE-family HTH domain